MNLEIDLAVLDIAGTTVQEHGLVYRALAEATGAADVSTWMGADKREAVRALLGDGASDAEVERVHAEFRSRLAELYEAEPPAPFPGVTDTLQLLRANGVKVALATGFDHEVTDALLRDIGWDEDVVDAVVCAEDVPAGRPAPYMVFQAMEATGVWDVNRVLVAGDSVLDVEAGVNAGAGFVVAVLSGGVPAEVLGAHRHTHLLETVAELPAVLGVRVNDPV